MKSGLTSENLPLFSGTHEICCHVCNGKGVLLCCDFCPYAYHPSCLHPPMTQRPNDYWVCPVCLQDIRSEHTSDITLRCKRHQDAIHASDMVLQRTSTAAVAMQSFVPTRVSSSSSSSFSFSRNAPLSPSHSPSIPLPLSKSQYQFQSAVQPSNPLQLVLLSCIVDRIRSRRSDRTTFSSHFRGVYNRGTKWNAQIQVRGKKIGRLNSDDNA